MPTNEPTAEMMSTPGNGTDPNVPDPRPTPWPETRDLLSRGGWFWVSTVRPDGRPHAMPIFAVWSESVLFFASKDTAQKSRNVAANGRAVVSTDAGDLHVIVEGRAQRVTDGPRLERASKAFREIYDWPTAVQGDKLDADYGAPTSGGPPYDVIEVTPTKAFALPAESRTHMPTRYRF